MTEEWMTIIANLPSWALFLFVVVYFGIPRMMAYVRKEPPPMQRPDQITEVLEQMQQAHEDQGRVVRELSRRVDQNERVVERLHTSLEKLADHIERLTKRLEDIA